MKGGTRAKSKLRITVDTNVIVSALHFGGKPEEVLFAANAGFVQLYLSPFILKETRRVLTRKLRWPTERVKEAEKELQEIANIVVPEEEPQIIQNNKADNAILACAVAGRVHFLVTGDKKHLLPLRKFRGIKIVSPEAFLKKISLHYSYDLYKNQKGF